MKLPLIERDLAYFANLGTSPGPWAAEEAEAFAAEIRHRAAASDLRATPPSSGFLYVMEGSTLGALVLHPYVIAAYRLPGTDGVAYYTSGDRDRWVRFTNRMNQALTDPEHPGPGHRGGPQRLPARRRDHHRPLRGPQPAISIPSPSSRAISIRWTSLVPSPISRILESRHIRATGYSFMKP